MPAEYVDLTLPMVKQSGVHLRRHFLDRLGMERSTRLRTNRRRPNDSFVEHLNAIGAGDGRVVMLSASCLNVHVPLTRRLCERMAKVLACGPSRDPVLHRTPAVLPRRWMAPADMDDNDEDDVNVDEDGEEASSDGGVDERLLRQRLTGVAAANPNEIGGLSSGKLLTSVIEFRGADTLMRHPTSDDLREKISRLLRTLELAAVGGKTEAALRRRLEQCSSQCMDISDEDYGLVLQAVVAGILISPSNAERLLAEFKNKGIIGSADLNGAKQRLNRRQQQTNKRSDSVPLGTLIDCVVEERRQRRQLPSTEEKERRARRAD